ncbi:MAG: CorA family divalent cation transporter, partial [Cyclobacteriaceae bacterium]
MISIFYKSEGKTRKAQDLKLLNKTTTSQIIWIDLLGPREEDIKLVEDHFNLRLQTRAEAEEIESSSRYYETEEKIMANSNFLIRNNNEYRNEIVSFVVKNNVLISYRNSYLKSVNDTIRKLEVYSNTTYNCFDILISIFEIRIDEDADMIEYLAREITNLGKNITIQRNLDEEVIINITRYQEVAMMIRENIIDKQRIISGILKSQYFPQENYPKLRVMIKDIGSLLEYTTFGFERLEYLQNT